MKDGNPLVWLVMVAGMTLGIILTAIGLLLLQEVGPTTLIAGLVLLAFGGAAFFTRHRG